MNTLNFGNFYNELDESGNFTGRVYKCIGIAADYYQTGEEVVLMARIGDGGYSNGLLYIPVGNFMADFEEIRK